MMQQKELLPNAKGITYLRGILLKESTAKLLRNAADLSIQSNACIVYLIRLLIQIVADKIDFAITIRAKHLPFSYLKRTIIIFSK